MKHLIPFVRDFITVREIGGDYNRVICLPTLVFFGYHNLVVTLVRFLPSPTDETAPAEPSPPVP
jgi:hypothetical protein